MGPPLLPEIPATFRCDLLYNLRYYQILVKAMSYQTDDLRIREIKELISPEKLINDFPITDAAAETVYSARHSIHRILHGEDDRILVVIGPCSVHDPDAARQLEDAAAMFANVLRRLEPREWDRTVVYNYPAKQLRTLGWVAVHTLHEIRHHLRDVQRQLT